MRVIETSGADARFQLLCRELDQEYFRLFGEASLKYRDVNRIEEAACVVLVLEDKRAIGCGCIRSTAASDAAEIKRVLVKPEWRRRGIGAAIVKRLEEKAKEFGFTAIILEAGKEMPWAIALYEKLGYRFIPNYGSFDRDEAVVCMEKDLK
ncbi:GNAT family N-acetyltransferase [Christensenella tenuis]|uniref:GNAT family N-acetyltransferase n=1 Tax=Christensenella tenuis TaxID=2763033 RepID=A0ABR7ECD4_9FIRM|nr:GNAT family N-acetyltransferase [Christensenella tenuis]MBC5647401.1 GNAT family N-acetyltransferase [Christensenella tenuis]